MTPLDFILWALAALIGFACFVLIVMLLLSLIRAITRKPNDATRGDSFVFNGVTQEQSASDIASQIEKNGHRRGRGES